MQNTNVMRLRTESLSDRQQREDTVIRSALAILAKRMAGPGDLMQDPGTVKRYLRLKLGQLEHEVFGLIYLDCKNRLIAHEELFRGSLKQAQVYPREIVKRVLAHNANSVLLFHNHPSGVPEPSEADKLLTGQIQALLTMIDVNLLDHLIVTATRTHSMAEVGQL